MVISVQTLVELIFVVLILKLIVARWKPPIQESLQAIMCITIGSLVGYSINPTKDGVITAIIASGVAFYGGDLFNEFKSIKEEIKDNNIKK